MKQPIHWLRPAVAAAVGAVLIFIFSPAARAADHLLLSTHVPAVVASGRLQATGSLPDTNRLHLAISLPQRNEAQLDQLLKQLYDPNSPNYHQYQSVAQFTESFGPSQADYQALRDFAKASGLRETATYPNRQLLSVDASVADIKRVFHVNILLYHHPRENRQFYAPDKEPTLDLSVPALHISGLDNYVLPHPLIQKKLGGKGTTNAPLNGSQPGGFYWGSDLRRAYAPGVGLNGAGQNAGLFEYDGYFASDIIAYEQSTGLPNVTLTNVAVDGGIPGAPGAGVDEVSLDIEMVMAMAPGISKIFVYESPGSPAVDVLSQMASDNTCKQISSSWVFGGGTNNDIIFKELAAQGQSFFQASGDSDAYVGAIDSPGDDPYITLVGGTELVMNGLGISYNSESVWNTGYGPPGGAPQYSNYWGSGGGISTTYLIPSWQQGINMSNNLGSTTNRNTPDVALTADNIWVDSNQGLDNGGFMGTSCAAPLWCGFTAMINQQAAIYGYAPVGFINPAVYAIGKSNIYASCFHDTTVGNNFWAGSPTNFPAVPGYDLCTGWGTPTGSNLINALVPPLYVPVLFVVTNTITNDTLGIIGYDQCSGLTFYITNEGIVTATGIQGYLYSTTLGAIVGQATASFPDLLPHTSAASTTEFTLSTEPSFVCGTPIDLVLVLTCDQAVRTNTVQISSGIVAPPVVFANSTPISIPEQFPAGITSAVMVSNLSSAAKITVSVYAQVAEDEGLQLKLISPDGTTILLTAPTNGGLGANYGTACSAGSQTIFDDNASASINAGTAPFVGNFQPEQPLSSLLPAYGANLNGVWLLNAVEQFAGDAATLECWSLNVTPYSCLDGGGQCPGSGLFLTMSASPNPVVVGSNVVFTLSVSNAGPSPANDVVISQTLPPGFVFDTTSNYPVETIYGGSSVTLSLGSLPVYGAAIISEVTTPYQPGDATSVASVTSSSLNLNSNNATASASTRVTLPLADLAVSISASTGSLLEGGPVTFTIVVTNNGPFTAMGVVLTNELPPNVTYISSSNMTAGGLLAVLGNLPVGSNAVASVTVSPNSTGSFTDTAQVGLSPLETDPNSLNNSASYTVTVGPSADLAVSASVTPPTVVAGKNCTYAATVVNNGPSGASDVVFSQTIPGGTGLNSATFVSSTTNVIVTNGVITWNIGTLSSGASLAITNVLKTPIIQNGGRPISLSSTFSVFGQPGDANTNNNVVTLMNVVETPTVTIVPAGAMLISQSGSLPNGAINPGETVGVEFYLENTGNIPTASLVGTLQATGGVTLPSGPQNYGSVGPGGAPAGEAFSFTASGTNGGTLVATLSLQDGSTSLGTVSYDFFLPIVQTFWNTNPIYIPNTNKILYPEDEGPANPYPSAIVVSNVTGYVSKVTVTVSNMYHTYPNDIGILLVGPETNIVLMDAAVEYGSGITGTTITFDSTATTVLPAEVLPGESNLITGFSYKPASYNPDDIFTNAAAPPYGANLGVLNGLSANGTWLLYAHDDAAGDAGGISNGWSLTFTQITPVNSTNSPYSAYLQASSLAGSLQLTLLGQPGQEYAIQISSDLLNWTSVLTNIASMSSGTFIYTDTQTNAPARFYRGVRLPQ